MIDFLSREEIRDRIAITQNATYADILESDEDGQESLKEGLDPRLAQAIEAIEVQDNRLISIKLVGKRSRKLNNRSTKTSSGKR
jgi:hypothetical protein